MKKLIVILGILFGTIAYADHEKSLEDNSLYMQQLPSLCGTPDKIEVYLKHFEFTPVHLSLGRTRMMKDGEPVYMMTYMVNDNKTESATVLTIPNNTESCILYHTFDLVMELKEKQKN